MSHNKMPLIVSILVLALATGLLSACRKVSLNDNALFGSDGNIIDQIDWMCICEIWKDSEYEEFFSTNDKKEIARVIEMFNGWEMKADPDLAVDGLPDYEIRFGDKVSIGYFKGLGGKTAIIGEEKYYELPDAFVEYLKTQLPQQ